MHADGGVGSTVLNSGRTCAPHVAEGNESSAKARGIVCACMHACWLDRAAGWLKTGRRGAVLARAELSRKGERGGEGEGRCCRCEDGERTADRGDGDGAS